MRVQRACRLTVRVRTRDGETYSCAEDEEMAREIARTFDPEPLGVEISPTGGRLCDWTELDLGRG